ncbi:hypothetical protein BT67DRAFT_152344 [Trichocladium antarcticum]|uniref:Uncharacterized protein n=1 Tax=Trichocladium antarcticum TaxID=1450529 RepID=A0AAN6UEJ4_9PEZI|nr:hypothetical protein BT67DRAFT_152344 [Trichocladium antarcticum]
MHKSDGIYVFCPGIPQTLHIHHKQPGQGGIPTSVYVTLASVISPHGGQQERVPGLCCYNGFAISPLLFSPHRQPTTNPFSNRTPPSFCPRQTDPSFLKGPGKVACPLVSRTYRQSLQYRINSRLCASCFTAPLSTALGGSNEIHIPRIGRRRRRSRNRNTPERDLHPSRTPRIDDADCLPPQTPTAISQTPSTPWSDLSYR